MLEEIKKIQGICNNDFDNVINNSIASAKADLKAIGIVSSKIDKDDALIRTAILTYVLSFLDVNNSEMYANSYLLQKDVLRHISEYTKEEADDDGVH